MDAAREIGGGSHVAGFGSLEIRTSIAWSLQIAPRWGGELQCKERYNAASICRLLPAPLPVLFVPNQRHRFHAIAAFRMVIPT